MVAWYWLIVVWFASEVITLGVLLLLWAGDSEDACRARLYSRLYYELRSCGANQLLPGMEPMLDRHDEEIAEVEERQA
jgi:hypothetical protein